MRFVTQFFLQVFVDFFAEWCGPCKMVAPKIHEFAKTYPNIIFVKIDVDEAGVRGSICGV
jgi:thiol-disulfide isomerase/thioredoxin